MDSTDPKQSDKFFEDLLQRTEYNIQLANLALEAPIKAPCQLPSDVSTSPLCRFNDRLSAFDNCMDTDTSLLSRIKAYCRRKCNILVLIILLLILGIGIYLNW